MPVVQRMRNAWNSSYTAFGLSHEASVGAAIFSARNAAVSWFRPSAAIVTSFSLCVYSPAEGLCSWPNFRKHWPAKRMQKSRLVNGSCGFLWQRFTSPHQSTADSNYLLLSTIVVFWFMNLFCSCVKSWGREALAACYLLHIIYLHQLASALLTIHFPDIKHRQSDNRQIGLNLFLKRQVFADWDEQLLDRPRETDR